MNAQLLGLLQGLSAWIVNDAADMPAERRDGSWSEGYIEGIGAARHLILNAYVWGSSAPAEVQASARALIAAVRSIDLPHESPVPRHLARANLAALELEQLLDRNTDRPPAAGT